MTDAPTPKDLPFEVPLFPLAGALLLPGGDLPLNVFEPRYISMMRKSMASDRLIGMIQPSGCGHKMPESVRPFYSVGCVGRIAAFEETKDGRLLITLHGIVRFALQSHTAHEEGYRVAKIDCTPYQDDFREIGPLPECLTRPTLLEKLLPYLAKEELYVDWSLADNVPDARFYTLLAMVCPFNAAEKQALLEAPNFEERCRLMKTLLELSCAQGGNCSPLERPC